MPSILIEGEDILKMSELFDAIWEEAQKRGIKILHACLSN